MMFGGVFIDILYTFCAFFAHQIYDSFTCLRYTKAVTKEIVWNTRITKNNYSSQAERIGYEALMEVTGKYGFGDEDADVLQPPSVQLAYHNAQHTLRVRNATRKLAAHQGLSHYDTELFAVMICSAPGRMPRQGSGPER